MSLRVEVTQANASSSTILVSANITLDSSMNLASLTFSLSMSTSSIAFFLGAALAEGMRRAKPKLAEDMVLPVSSGFIAGESLLGIGLAMAKAFGVMPK